MPPLGRVVVTGVNGFVGRHLVAELRSAGATVVGVGQEPEPAADGLTDYVPCDLTERWPGVDADAVVHLAGLSAVGRSFAEPQRYLAGSSAMMTHLGEHLLRTGTPTRLLAVSTGAVYGGAAGPRHEDSPTVPSSPYVVSKLLLEQQVGYYARRGVDALVVRPFNHIGPGQGPGFLVPDLLAAARHAGPDGRMLVGDLSTRRDYTDVRDVARAYRLLLETPEPPYRLFNVCSGRSWSGTELLDLLQTCGGPDGGPDGGLGDVEAVVDERRLRPDEPREVVGDAGRLRRAVGWRPLVDVPTSVLDFLVAARAETSGPGAAGVRRRG